MRNHSRRGQEIQEHAKKNDGEDDQPADILSERKRYASGNDKDDDDRSRVMCVGQAGDVRH